VRRNFSKYNLCWLLFLFCLGTTIDAVAQEEEYDTIADGPPPALDRIPSAINENLVEKWKPGAGIESVPFTLRHLPDSMLANLRKDPDFWYADSIFKQDSIRFHRESSVKNNTTTTPPPKRKENPPPPQSYDDFIVKDKPRTSMQTVLWIIIIAGGLALIFVLLAARNVSVFGRKKKLINDPVETDETTDIFAIKYISEIDRAAMAGNYRLAIRLMFLRLLKSMTEQNIIDYKHDRTNYDYLVQLNTSPYYSDFFRVTRHYEYTWYGKFNVSPDAYEIIKNEFDTLEAKVNRSTA
jgi:hypothetical protein